jgi:predicted permease
LQHDLHWISNASMEDADGSQPWLAQDGISWLTVVARVPASVGSARAGAAFATAVRQARDRLLETVDDPARREFLSRERLELLPGARGLSSLRENFSAPLAVLMATAAMVLLIGCANLASLLLARGAARSREFALRLSLGARRGRLIRQMLTESVALSALGGAAGLGVALWGSGALLRLASPSGRVPLDVAIDWRLVAFTALVSFVTGIAFGLAPALRLSRADLAEAMKPGGRVTGAADRLGPLPFGRVLVVGQVALSLTLLIGAVLFLRTFSNLVHMDSGFDRTQIISARFDPRLSQIPPDQVPALYDRLLEAGRRLPGSESVSLAVSGAVTGSARVSGLIVAGQPRQPEPMNSAREDFIGPDYFRLMGIPVVRGRDFGSQDVAGARDVVIINETMARAFFGGADPIGRRLGYDEPAEMEVVGVVRDSLVDGLRRPAPKLVYHVLRQHPEEVARNLYVRVSGSADALKPMLAQAVAKAEPGLAMREVVTLDELTERTVANERLVSRLTGAFGALAVLVACLGLYGTISYSVARRTGEIGVRIALGATPGRVMRQVIGETAWLVGAGTVAGVLLALGLMGYTATLLYGLSPRDPVTLAGSALALVVIGVLAGLVPARRAANVDPLRALRLE